MYKVALEEILFSIFLWLIAFIHYKPAFNLNKQGKGNYSFFLFIVISYCVFAFTAGDFPHYKELYEILYKGAPNYSLEDFYYQLILGLPHSYYLWRFVVWGLSTIVLVLTFKRLKCPPNFTCLIFVLIIMEYFSAPRNTLGYVVLFYALTFILCPLRNKSLSYLIAVLGVITCTFLHKSMPLYIFISLVSFIPMKKWMYLLSFIIFPVIYGSFYFFAQYVLSVDIGNEAFNNTGSLYLEGDNFSSTNIFGYLSMVVHRLPIILLTYYIISRVLKKEIQNNVVAYFSRNAFWLMYLSCVFFNQSTSSFLSPRFWDASIYPLVYAFPLALYMKQEKIVKVGYKLLLIACAYTLLYAIYIAV